MWGANLLQYWPHCINLLHCIMPIADSSSYSCVCVYFAFVQTCFFTANLFIINNVSSLFPLVPIGRYATLFGKGRNQFSDGNVHMPSDLYCNNVIYIIFLLVLLNWIGFGLVLKNGLLFCKLWVVGESRFLKTMHLNEIQFCVFVFVFIIGTSWSFNSFNVLNRPICILLVLAMISPRCPESILVQGLDLFDISVPSADFKCNSPDGHFRHETSKGITISGLTCHYIEHKINHNRCLNWVSV